MRTNNVRVEDRLEGIDQEIEDDVWWWIRRWRRLTFGMTILMMPLVDLVSVSDLDTGLKKQG